MLWSFPALHGYTVYCKYCACVGHYWSYVAFLSADIVDGNLKSVMRIILALAAHFKPSANHRAASGGGRSLTRSSSSHNPLSPVALAQGAAAALASARHDASQPARTIRLHRYAGSNTINIDTKPSMSFSNIQLCNIKILSPTAAIIC